MGSKEKSDGLGLAYINTIISKNGGFIKLEKEKDITAFNIFLPLKMKGDKIYNILYAGHDENFKFILETFLKKNKFDFRISNHYESFKNNLINNDYHVGILDEEIIKGKSRIFYNDIKNLKHNTTPLIIITGGKFE